MNQMWQERDLPILQAVAEAEQRGESLNLDGIAAATGLDLPKVQAGARALSDARLIDGAKLEMLDIGLIMSDICLLGEGRRAIGQWPSSDPFDNLVNLIQARIATETDPEKKSKLQRFAGQVGEVGRDVLTGVLTALAKQQAGLQ
jgi:hypothetical protein